MDTFRLNRERSLALHAAVATKLRRDPEILDRAREKLDEWLARGGGTTPLWKKWRVILDRPVEEVTAFLTERSEEADWLRKASSFSGALDPEERLHIFRDVRQRLESTR